MYYDSRGASSCKPMESGFCPQRSTTSSSAAGLRVVYLPIGFPRAAATAFCCNKPFGTRQMVDAMLGRLAGHSMFAQGEALRRLQMCADCRVVDMMASKNEVSVLKPGSRFVSDDDRGHPGRDASAAARRGGGGARRFLRAARPAAQRLRPMRPCSRGWPPPSPSPAGRRSRAWPRPGARLVRCVLGRWMRMPPPTSTTSLFGGMGKAARLAVRRLL